MAQWVQHKSGQGEKWEVYENLGGFYSTVPETTAGYNYRLPQSEYVPCEPPEQWEEVTDKLRLVSVPAHEKAARSVEEIRCGHDTLATLCCGGKYTVSFNPFVVKRRRG